MRCRTLGTLDSTVVGRVFVHQSPEPLDRVKVRTIGWSVMKPDPTGGPRQPRHHHLGVVIAGVVEKHMDHPLGRIVELDHCQKCDQGRGVDRQLVAHEGGARLQVDRALDVEAVPAAGLIDGDLGVLGRPAADRPAPCAGWTASTNSAVSSSPMVR